MHGCQARRRPANALVVSREEGEPTDLPIDQPTTFRFVLNLRTVRSVGLTTPQSVLAQATAIIQ